MIRRMMAILGLLLLAILAVAGTWTPNSFIYKPSTGARGEGDKKTFDSGLDRVDARLAKEIWVGDPAYGTTLPSAVTAISGNQALLRIPAGTWSIGANLTIPANVTLKLERGAILSIATGVTVTINGAFEAGLYQCLSRTGTGQVVFGAGSVKEVQAVWFGTNTAAITHAFAAVPSGASLRFNAGYSYTFSPSSTVTVTGKSINLVCDPGVVIDATGSTANPLLTLTGSVGSFTSLGAETVIGSRSITVEAGLAATLSEGDLIALTSDTSFGGSGTYWSPNSTSYFKGELAEVLSVSGTTVNLKNSICDVYSTSDKAAKISPITGGLTNFNMKGATTNNQIGVTIFYAKNFKVVGGNLSGFAYTCLSFTYSYGIDVGGYTATNFWKTGGGTNYGLMLASCQNASVHGCNISGGRHAITTGGRWVNRFINIGPNNILDNDSVNTTAKCLDPHENIENSQIFGNQLKNGLGVEGRNMSAYDNIITIGRAASTCISAAVTDNTNYLKIINNKITIPTIYGGSSSNAIFCYATKAVTLNHLDVSGNEIIGEAQSLVIEPAVSVNFTINQLDIKNNNFDNTGSSTYSIYLRGYDASNILIIKNISISGNALKFINGTPVYGQMLAATNLNIDNNFWWKVSGAAGTLIALDYTNTTIDTIRYKNNTTRNDVPIVGFSLRANSNFLEFSGNNLSGAIGETGLYANEILIKDNYESNFTGYYNLNGRYFSKIFGYSTSSGQGYNVESWGTAAPTSGAWKRGDIIVNTSAAGGGAPGWVCSTTGTFGGASDSSGTTDGSTGTVTNMTSTSAFNVGAWVNVSAGFSTTGPFKILSKTATSVTLNANSNSVQNNVTTSTSNPIFKSMANLGS